MTDSIAQRARLQGAPLIDGDTATFVWLGEQAPLLAGDFTDWERGTPVELQRLAPSVWVYRLELPADAYMEYAFFEGKERLPDTLNPRTTPNGVGDTNHFFYMPRGKPTSLAVREPGVPAGRVIRHILETRGMAASRRRAVYLYQPPVDAPCPLLVVWDGYDYLRRVALTVILDNLIAQQRIRPLALAMIQNGGPARSVEYTCSEASLGLLHACVLPLAQRQLNLLDVSANPGAYGVLGASLGGLMALFTALRSSPVFGKALCQSGAFRLDGYESLVFDLLRHGERKPVEIWMDVGLYDFKSLLPANRDMADLLNTRDYPVTYREYPGGHNYSAWRDEVWHGLEKLFPP